MVIEVKAIVSYSYISVCDFEHISSMMHNNIIDYSVL